MEADTITFNASIRAGENSYRREKALKHFRVMALDAIASTMIFNAAISANEKRYWWEFV